MSFDYRVRDPMGNSHTGTLEAATLDDASQQLRRDGFQVLSIEESSDGELGLFPKRIAHNDIIYVTAQLAIMVDTGITLSAALSGIVDQEPNPSLKRVLGQLRDAVEEGENFSTALARYPHLFDKTYCALVKASEATGSLGTMLDRIAAYLRKQAETRAKVRAAMAYPIVMMMVASGVTIFLLTYVLPKFMPLFKSKGASLPAPTRIMMSLSSGLQNYWYLWIGGAIAAIVGAVLSKRTEPGRRAFDWVRINMPVLGPMFRKVTISRSIRTLGTMLASGVPIMEAIRLAGDVSGNFYYETLWQQVLEQVTGGARICETLRGNPLFPRMLTQMISAGEETGRLDEVLERVSTYYDGEVETSVKAATSLIEPIMICIMGVVVGTIGLALMLPIFSLSKQP